MTTTVLGSAARGALRDLRYAACLLRRAPRESAMVVLCIATGIGITGAMLAIVDSIVFRPRSFIASPERVVSLDVRRRLQNGTALDGLANVDYVALAGDIRSFEFFAAQTDRDLVAESGRGAAAAARVAFVTSGVFRLTSRRAESGRYPVDDKEWGRDDFNAVVSSDFVHHLGLSPERVLGSTIRLAGTPYAIIGVAPSGFQGVSRSRMDVWVPLGTGNAAMFGPLWDMNPGAAFLEVVGRLRPSVDPRQAAAEVRARLSNSSATGMFASRVEEVTLVPVTRPEYVFGRRGLVMPTVLAALGGAVFLVTVGNVMLLFWTGMLSRATELAVREALGASAGDIVRLSLVRLWVLFALGAAIGLGIATTMTQAARRLNWVDIALTGTVAGITLGLSALGMLVASLPVAGYGAVRRRRLASLTTAGGGTGRLAGRIARLLVGGQVAITFVLCSLALLFSLSLRTLLTVDLGFDADRVIAADVTGGTAVYHARDLEQALGPIRDRLRQVPGVLDAAIATSHPYGATIRQPVAMRPAMGAPGEQLRTVLTAAEPAYFRVLGLRILAGRGFTPGDARGAVRVAIVNEALVDRLFARSTPLGECLTLVGVGDPCTRIVGVVANVVQHDILAAPEPGVFVPLAQWENEAPVRTLVIRPSGSASAGLLAARRAMGESEQVSLALFLIDQHVRRQLQPWFRAVGLSASLGALALAVSLFGVYAAVAGRVATRRREFGLRLALGASSRAVSAPVYAEVLRMVGGGIGAGLVVILLLTPIVSPLVLGAGAHLGAVLATVSLAILGGAGAAVTGIIRTVRSVDPRALLRES